MRFALRITDGDGRAAERTAVGWRLEEHATIRIEVDGGPWEMDLDGRTLPWQPELSGAEVRLPFAVGRLRLTFRRERVEHRTTLELAAAGHKLGPALWEMMLADLERWLGGVTSGVEGPRRAAVGLQGLDVPSAVEAVLPLVEPFERAVFHALDKPKLRTIDEVSERPIHQARRADAATLAWIGRHPREAAWLRPEADPDLVGAPPLLPLNIPTDTLDHAVNRHLTWLVIRVAGRLREAVRRLSTASCSGLNDTKAWRDARCAALSAASDRLERLIRVGPLRGLRPEPANEAALMVLLDAPAYARAHRLGRRILSSGMLPEADASVATRPSFHLYELWCFRTVARALSRGLVGWEQRYSRLWALTSLTGDGEGAKWTALGPDGQRVELAFNMSFPSILGGDASGPHALSRGRRPDLVLSYEDADQRAWVALDAKYRVGAGDLGDAFSSAHIYRDALRWPAMGGAPRAAVLLCPRSDDETALWFADPFLSSHGFGAVALGPATDAPEALSRVFSFLPLP